MISFAGFACFTILEGFSYLKKSQHLFKQNHCGHLFQFFCVPASRAKANGILANIRIALHTAVDLLELIPKFVLDLLALKIGVVRTCSENVIFIFGFLDSPTIAKSLTSVGIYYGRDQALLETNSVMCWATAALEEILRFRFTGSGIRPPVLQTLSYAGEGEESHSKGLFMCVKLLTWFGAGKNGAQICSILLIESTH